MQYLTDPQKSTILFLAICTASIVIALTFEHIGGYKPCPLCLQERYAYYAGIPLSLGSVMALRADRSGWVAILITLAGIAFLINTGLGLYHSGIEWHWWQGPTACSGASNLTPQAENFLESLEKIKVIRCDEAPWRLFGLSFAGWNMIISFFLFLFSLSIFKSLRQN